MKENLDKEALQALADSLKEGETVTVSRDVSVRQDIENLRSGKINFFDVCSEAENPHSAVRQKVSRARRDYFSDFKIQFNYDYTDNPRIFRVTMKSPKPHASN